jgi:hypothetical protein
MYYKFIRILGTYCRIYTIRHFLGILYLKLLALYNYMLNLCSILDYGLLIQSQILMYLYYEHCCILLLNIICSSYGFKRNI